MSRRLNDEVFRFRADARASPGENMISIARQFSGREHTPLVQFIKYGICGGVATAVHILIFFLCAWKLLPALGLEDPLVKLFGLTVIPVTESARAWHALADNAIAFVFSNMTAYVLNILWVFERGRHHWLVELGLFYAVSGTSLVVGSILQTFLIQHFGLATTPAFGANVIASMSINYVLRKFMVFKG
jgi:putative flippase GtrA